MNKLYRCLSHTYVWYTLALLAFIINLNIEFEWVVIRCCPSEHSAEIFNEIIKNLLYSYIAAVIFHFIVNYCPYKMKQEALEPLLNFKIKIIGELLRQSKESVLNPFDFNNTNSRDENEYVQMFYEKNLLEKHPFFQNKTIYERLCELRTEIGNNVDYLLSYRDYLSDKQFYLINNVAQSCFILTELHPNDEIYGDGNQKEIGSSIYKLYGMFSKQLYSNQLV